MSLLNKSCLPLAWETIPDFSVAGISASGFTLSPEVFLDSDLSIDDLRALINGTTSLRLRAHLKLAQNESFSTQNPNDGTTGVRSRVGGFESDFIWTLKNLHKPCLSLSCNAPGIFNFGFEKAPTESYSPYFQGSATFTALNYYREDGTVFTLVQGQEEVDDFPLVVNYASLEIYFAKDRGTGGFKMALFGSASASYSNNKSPEGTGPYSVFPSKGTEGCNFYIASTSDYIERWGNLQPPSEGGGGITYAPTLGNASALGLDLKTLALSTDLDYDAKPVESPYTAWSGKNLFHFDEISLELA